MINFLNLIIARLDGDSISETSYKAYIEKLVREGIAGFVVFGGEYEELREFIANLQQFNKFQASNHSPLIIASDIERGVGQQIKGGTIIPSQMGITAGFDLEKDSKELKTLYSIVIKEAKEVGINFPLIPVVDVNTEPYNPIISTRAFSDKSTVVSKYGNFLIEFFSSEGLKTCAKHFPGHGASSFDSHLNQAYLTEDFKKHIRPFKSAIKAKVPAIMVGHIIVTDYDIVPATLSEKIMKNLLRQDLGFKGLVLTDAMSMKALKDYDNPHAMALKAGADIILHPEDPYAAAEELKFAYKHGYIDDKILNEALSRISTFKSFIHHSPTTIHQPPSTNHQILSTLIHNAFKRTVTVLKKSDEPLSNKKIIPYLAGCYSEAILKIFKDYFGQAYDINQYRKTDAMPMTVIFTEIKAANLSYTLNVEQFGFIDKILSENKAILISFGNPYMVKRGFYRKSQSVALMYDCHETAVLAFLDVFSNGLENATGRLPVRLWK